MKLNWFKTRNRVQRYHQTMINRHGLNSSLALGWRETADQLVRFEALARIGDLNHRTVLDAGCGYADLYPFLKERYPNLAGYIGIEQVEELFIKATTAFPAIDLRRVDFMVEALPISDYVFASGSLNYNVGGKDYIFRAIKTLYEASRIGFGFNLLREISGKGSLVAYDPAVILNYCQSLSPKVVMLDDYAPEDFTIFMYHQPDQAS
ncbi:class I SAM-dependent methyltransferase [Mucilaginibacter sp. CAU 1740]|uniref:class I SAM-dependent methyltransferase n=1 Tax=Mucilaginibacter sp. CAU 1740 TaxID=3140365 RepID=UPI00325AA1AE